MSSRGPIRVLELAIIALAVGVPVAESPAARIEHKSLGSGIALIAIEGEIRAGDEQKFRRLSVQFDKAIVALASEGGALQPAIEIGKMVRLKEFPTVVLDDYRCVSACALIWVAGETRYLAPRGAVGFHASYRDEGGRKVETGLGNALVGRYLTLLNLPEKAVLFATIASPDEVLWLDLENSDDAGIDFEIFGEEQVSPPALTSSNSGTGGAASGRTGWRLIASSGKIDYYMDVTQTYLAGPYRASWTRADHSKNENVSYFESKDLWYFDCKQRRMAIKAWANFDESGQLADSHEVPDRDLDWQIVVPESVGESRFNAICS
jgi:hypothetical protein